MEENAKQVAQLLKILANEHRLLILCALSEEPRTVGEIHSFVPAITASALSQHLGHMKTAGLLDSQKQGMNVVYRIADPRVLRLFEVIKAEYCQL